MKRCPKCNRTYTTDTQKFCTHDGVVLEVLGVSQGDTIRIDNVQIDDDAPTKSISRELASEVTGGFDPFKTVMARQEDTTAARPRDTQDLAPPTSTPLPSPPPSPSQPTMQLSGLGAASAPLQPPPSAPLPAQPSVTPRPPAKKSRLPLVLGILAVLLVLGVGVLGAAYVFVVKPMLAARRAVVVEPPRPPTNEPTPNTEATPNNIAKKDTNVAPEPPPYSPPADAVEFVNSIKNLDGKLADHYVDFSFYYPNRWEKDPSAGVPGASNFAKVERRLPPDFTQENFAVGWYSSAGSAEADRSVYHTLAANLSAQFAKNFPEYRKVSEGETKAGVYDGYEFRFEGASRSTAKGDLKLWGRVIFVPPVDGGKNGVTLLMLATSLAPELKTVDDVGVKGELPMMLASFRFKKK
jgi:hypothetical protein